MYLIYKNLKYALLIFATLLTLGIIATPSSSVFAQGTVTPDAGTGGSSAQPQSQPTERVRVDCRTEGGERLSSDNCGIVRYIILFINVLSAMVGIVVVASIIVGGIQYSSAGSDPQKVSAAKNRIRNAIIALLFFVFGYALLNYLVPGGVL